MRVSLDGGVTWVDAGEVRVEAPEDPEASFDLTLVVTTEGLIIDQWMKEGDQPCIATASMLWEDVPGILR